LTLSDNLLASALHASYKLLQLVGSITAGCQDAEAVEILFELRSVATALRLKISKASLRDCVVLPKARDALVQHILKALIQCLRLYATLLLCDLCR
tara:strand:+ start:364 stop:651 length:288 start_codon:yes stop_codon:yes gene_type:complete